MIHYKSRSNQSMTVIEGVPQDNNEKFIKQIRKEYPELEIPSRLKVKGNFYTTKTGLKITIQKPDRINWLMNLTDTNGENEKLINEVCNKADEFYAKLIENLKTENEIRFDRVPDNFKKIMEVASNGTLTAADYISFDKNVCTMYWTNEQLGGFQGRLEKAGYQVVQDGITVNSIIYHNNSTYRIAYHTYANMFKLTKL